MCFFFFFNDTATTEIYTLSLHDALPISPKCRGSMPSLTATGTSNGPKMISAAAPSSTEPITIKRSEEHTSELQSHSDLVCRLLLEKKNQLKCILLSSTSWLTRSYFVIIN